MHIVVFNSRYWDRTLDVLYSHLSSGQPSVSDFMVFRLPSETRDLFSHLENFVPETLTLVGNFRNLEKEDPCLHVELAERFKSQTCPRMWLLFFDLHHTPQDLLVGKKTDRNEAAGSTSHDSFTPLDYFDLLAWPYEHFEPIEISESFDGVADNDITDVKRAYETQQVFISTFPDRLEFYHCVSKSEVVFSRWVSRLPKCFRFSIIGAPYLTRQLARKLLSASGYRIMPQFYFSRVLGFCLRLAAYLHRHLRPNVYAAWRIKSAIKFAYQVVLMSISRFTYVDGSLVNYPVRKYFEAPLAGAIMASPPSKTISALGFTPDKNYVAFHLGSSSFTDSKQGFFLAQSDKKRLIEESRELIANRHTVEKRTLQLRHFLNAHSRSV